jgi:hypothetical protein
MSNENFNEPGILLMHHYFIERFIETVQCESVLREQFEKVCGLFMVLK